MNPYGGKKDKKSTTMVSLHTLTSWANKGPKQLSFMVPNGRKHSEGMFRISNIMKIIKILTNGRSSKPPPAITNRNPKSNCCSETITPYKSKELDKDNPQMEFYWR
jgi:hypothetical protein